MHLYGIKSDIKERYNITEDM